MPPLPRKQIKDSVNKVVLYFSTILLGQFVSFILLPIITKNVNPQIYGEYALTLTIFNFIGVFGSSWIRNVSFRLYFDERNKSNNKRFFINSAVFQFFSIIFITLLIFPLMQLSFFRFGTVELFLVAALSIIAGDFASLTVNALRAEDMPRKYAITQVATSLTRLASISLGLWIGFKSPIFLLSCSVVSGLISGIFGVLFLKEKLVGNVHYDKIAINEITCLGLASLPTSIGGWILALSDRVVLKIFTNLETVGIYSVGYALADRLVGGITSAIFMMAWPSILEEHRNRGDMGATEAIHQALKVYAWLTIGPLVIVVACNNEIVSLLTSNEYQSASNILPIVAIGCWINGLKKYISRPLELSKKYKLMSIITVIAALLNLGLNFILIPKIGAIGAAISTLIAFCFSFILFIFCTDRKMIKVPIDHFLASILFAAAAVFVSWQFEGIVYRFLAYFTIYGIGILAFIGPLKNFKEKYVG